MYLFFHPSFEGLPTVALEAQAAELPCLISDTVSKETDITGLCKFVPIDDYDLWANGILEAGNRKRKNMMQQIVDAGYDVGANARWLQKFYENIGQG